MNRENLLRLLAETLERPYEEIAALPDGASLADMGLDSIRFIQFVVRLEEAGGIEVLDSDLLLSNFETVGSILQTMRKYEKPLKKALVLDCDGVLWRGAAGEEPLAIDESCAAFQNTVRRLSHRGVLLCLCSRNTAENIAEAFSALDMPLKREDFAAVRTGVTDKAAALADIAAELHIFPDSLVFADDSAYELGLVRALLPEVETVKADGSAPDCGEELELLFRALPPTELDRVRLHREQKEREKARLSCKTPEEYNRSLETVVRCGAAGEGELPRIAELSRRTNRCNLSDRRYTEEELRRLLREPDVRILSLSAADRYGDMGLVGAAVLREEGEAVTIESFFLSCRVFGRGFEQSLLERAREAAGGKILRGVFRETPKNRGCAAFYEENGVERI